MDTLELKQAELELLSEDIELFKKDMEKLKKLDNGEDLNIQSKINELKEKITKNEQEIKKWSPILENILNLQKEIKELNYKDLELSQAELAIKNEIKKYSRILEDDKLD